MLQFSVTATLDILASLGGCTTSEVQTYIHLFHNDRAGDGDTMLDILDVEPARRLKCCAHPCLCIENALDKTFASHERSVGRDKLISVAASHVFTSPSSSIFMLGLIALSKLLSPSHSQQSVSLYLPYKTFLKSLSTSDHDLKTLAAKTLKAQFKGFGANRFGRISHLAHIFIEHQPLIIKFFEDLVNTNQNKLFAACNAYLRSPWFAMCCRVSAVFNTSLVVPLLEALGIDEGKYFKSQYRSWEGIRSFFNQKLAMLESMSVTEEGVRVEDMIIAECSGNIREALQNQLNYMTWFTIPEEIKMKMQSARLTNSGCESEFAHLDNDCKVTSGNTSLTTLSNRHIIKRNKLFSHNKWK